MKHFKFFLCALAVCSVVPERVGAAILAHIQTNRGIITADLDFQRAPKTVANFIRLAEGAVPWTDPNDGLVKDDYFYDGTTFHRVIDNFVIQGGCPIGDGTGGPGWTFIDETDNGANHQLYSLSMANAGRNTNGSQFFIISANISTANAANLNGNHTVFGRVNLPASRAVVDAIELVEVGPGNPNEISRPVDPVIIQSVTIERTDAAARNFNIFDQNLPQAITPNTLPPLQIGDVDDDNSTLVISQQPRTQMNVFRSFDLENWSLVESRFIADDADPEDGISLARGEEDQAFFRVTQSSYAEDATSPSVFSDKQITFVALDPFNAQRVSFYDILLETDGTGIWRARNLAGLQAQGQITSSSITTQPYGGQLVLEGNLPYSSGYSIAYGLDPDLENGTQWAGTHDILYVGLGSLPDRRDFFIFKSTDP